ncbi:hypothetical protein CERSUDRAFT_109996 [Gelatoporia subvermispora B]|uniref:Uncharacterized protein n=1 Tax=Ceriporiopsis subvermispora (strain B) TaxID=914234 RepID=M2RAH7_CERS8|nr:hypothetical protein CERSUDRAFT_109996 [Gelatoporia subvermispora B]
MPDRYIWGSIGESLVGGVARECDRSRADGRRDPPLFVEINKRKCRAVYRFFISWNILTHCFDSVRAQSRIQDISTHSPQEPPRSLPAATPALPRAAACHARAHLDSSGARDADRPSVETLGLQRITTGAGQPALDDKVCCISQR